MKIPGFLPHSVDGLARLVCAIALAGLFFLSLSVLWPAPLPVIFAMGAGNAAGILAFALYLLIVLLDVRRAPPEVEEVGRSVDMKKTGSDSE